MSTNRADLILSISISAFGFHPAANVLNAGLAQRVVEVDYYRRLFQSAERASLHFLLLHDERALQPNQRYGRLDALSVLSRLAPETKRVGLVVSKPTTYSEPFTVSRELATLDFVSGGRAAWNVTTNGTAAEAANFGYEEPFAPSERYAIAEEFVEVSRKLWDSWEDNAVITDRESGLYLDPAKLHHINHVGRHFKIRGPQITYRPPQGHVVVVQIDQGDAGSPLSVEVADLLILHHDTLGQAKGEYAQLKAQAGAAGRQIKVLQSILPILGVSEASARARAEELDARAAIDLGRVTPPFAQRFVGTPQQLVDRLEQWAAAGAGDGFHFLPPLLPQGLDELTSDVIPELQARGLFHTSYAGQTLRENLGLARPQSQYAAPATGLQPSLA